jgi:hypothetical protein
LFSSLNWIFNNDQTQVEEALEDIQLQLKGKSTLTEENSDLQISPLKEGVMIYIVSQKYWLFCFLV